MTPGLTEGHGMQSRAGRTDGAHALVHLAGDWWTWPDFIVRSTGFPIGNLTALVDEEFTQWLGGASVTASDEQWQARWQTAVAATAGQCLDLARGEGIRAALTWLNRPINEDVLGWLHRHRGQSATRDKRRRRHERTLVRYLQRLHTRNESVGFFGPIAWGVWAAESEASRVVAGRQLAVDPRIFFEDWPVVALAEQFAADPQIRAGLPFVRRVGVRVYGRMALRARGAAYRLSPLERTLMGLADGQFTVDRAAEEIGRPGAEVSEALTALADADLVHWGFEIPVDLTPEQALRDQLVRLPPNRSVCAAIDTLDQLMKAVEAVRHASTPMGESHADALGSAFSGLEGTFRAVTGLDATRSLANAGRGRTLVHAQYRRDVEVTLGDGIRRALGPPLALVLTSARWMCWQAGLAFERIAASTCIELSPFAGPDVPLDMFCGRLAQRLKETHAFASIAERLQAIWLRVLDLPTAARSAHRRVDAIAEAVAAAFASPPPGWFAGRHHSPDVMIAARDVAALAAGEVDLVLGEVHIGVVTADSTTANAYPPAPEAIVQPVRAALGLGLRRFVPLHPRGERTLTGRYYPTPETFIDEYEYFSFGERTGRRGAPTERIIDARKASVCVVDGAALVRLPDGRTVGVLEALGEYLSYEISSSFRMLAPADHRPRVSIDRLVVCRETWRIDPTELLVDGTEWQAFRHIRSVVEARNMPRYLYWRDAPDAKPIFLDTTSPLSVNVMVGALAAARRTGRNGRPVTFTEMLPTVDRAWLPDRTGERYCSEFRMTTVDGASGFVLSDDMTDE